MARKKKYLITFLSIFFAMFYGFSLENTCKAVSLSDYQLTDEIMQDICDEIGLTAVSGDWTHNYTEYFNTMMRSVRARGDYHQVTLADCVFLGKNTNQLIVYFNSWRDNNQADGQDATLECNYLYIPVGTVALNTNFNLSCYQWGGWTYDSNNNITGASTSACYYWNITNSGYSYTNTLTGLNGNKLTECEHNQFSLSRILVLDNNWMYPDSVMFPCYTGSNRYNYDFLFYVNKIYLGDYTSTTPTGTPTTAPTGGGGGSSTDLTQTNNLINGVVSSLNDTPSGDDFSLPSSGDIINALNVPDISSDSKVSATDNFWLTITNGLYSALTSDIRYYDINFLGITFTLDNQAFIITNSEFNSFLSIVQIVCFVFVEYKIIRKLVNMFASGVFSQIMRAYAKIDISDLF